MSDLAYSWLNPMYKLACLLGIGETVLYAALAVCMVVFAASVVDRRGLPLIASIGLLYSTALSNVLYWYNNTHVWVLNDLLFTVFYIWLARRESRPWLKLVAAGFYVSMAVDAAIHGGSNYPLIALTINWVFITQMGLVVAEVAWIHRHREQHD